MKRIGCLAVLGLAVVVWTVLFCLCSCKTRYLEVQTLRVDSVSYKDTVVQVQLVPYRDSSAIKGDSSYLENPYAYSWAKWSDGVLQHSLVIKPGVFIPYVFHIPERVKMYKVGVPYTKEVVKEVEKPLSWWQTFFITSGKIGWLIGLIFIFIWSNKKLSWLSKLIGLVRRFI